ncbi:MAG: serine/threonine protein kinase [Nitrospirae bacterium]|nr:MAG: serine/threonine protein kinase [Nitrospirota bacterium]
MATIWRVVRQWDTMPMAMKIPRLKDGDDSSFIVCFEVEQMIMPRLSGRHVPKFIASGDFSMQPFLVMEHLPGKSLDVLMREAPLSPQEIAVIGAKVARALHDIHRQHVIHLDLTPDNILFRKSGEAVLIDFGLSRHEQLPDLMAEEFSLPMGTAPYISPEQVLGIRSDFRSDIFSLGVILYRLTTGEFPFDDPKSMAGLKRRLYLAPVPPRVLNKKCPNWLQEIILKCLEVDSDKRYDSGAQLALALENPCQVILTSRSELDKSDSLWTEFKRWIRYSRSGPSQLRSVARHLDTAPIIMAAVDISPGAEALSDAIRHVVKRIYHGERNARITCVTVRKTRLVGIDLGLDEAGKNLYVQYLTALKQWAQPMELPADRVSFHVLESPDAAMALINYAKSNHAEHIVIGARGSSMLRRFLGSVSSHVVAEAPCSVTVVRLHDTGDSGVTSDGYSGHG